MKEEQRQKAATVIEEMQQLLADFRKPVVDYPRTIRLAQRIAKRADFLCIVAYTLLLETEPKPPKVPDAR